MNKFYVSTSSAYAYNDDGSQTYLSGRSTESFNVSSRLIIKKKVHNFVKHCVLNAM